ncbi:hypothetical protein [Ornithinibacillus sp. 179-J 7C1 HS]
MMIRLTFPNRNSKQSSYTWNPSWIGLFESPWSILKKFQEVNSLNTRELNEVLAIEGFKTDKRVSLYGLGQLDRNLTKQALQFDLIQENKLLLHKLLSPLYNFKGDIEQRFLRQHLTFCPACLVNKYHSLLHQFLFIHKCPFHSIELLNDCPQCNQRIPFELDDTYYKSPFVCKCGFEFAKFDRRINTLTTIKIKDSNIMKWLKYEKKFIHSVNYSLQFMEGFGKDSSYQEEDFKYNLSDIFFVVENNKGFIHTKEKISLTRSIPQIINTREKKLKKYKLIFNKDHIISDLQSESYLMCNQLFKSIARHLRNTILKKHIGCIKNFTRYSDNLVLEDVCPYAIAYIIWRSRLQNFKSMDYVDNYGTTPFCREHYTRYGYPIVNGYE